MLAACRQEPDWLKFLPGGENQEWTATNEDQFNGLRHDVPATQTKLRADFSNFLTCVATHGPSNFIDTIMRESTSFRGIIETIKRAFGLTSHGEKFLSILDIKLEFSEIFTYEQGYMVVKDFCMQALHPIGKNFKGRAATTKELM